MSERKKVLVVDDDPVTRELLIGIMLHEGYEVISAIDGASALAMARAERPDLIITDGLLPKIHGFLVCQTIKEMSDPPKVIVLTGVYTKPTYRREVLFVYHADEVMTKPFNKAHLLACIEKLLKGSTADWQVAQTPLPVRAGQDYEKELLLQGMDNLVKR